MMILTFDLFSSCDLKTQCWGKNFLFVSIILTYLLFFFCVFNYSHSIAALLSLFCILIYWYHYWYLLFFKKWVFHYRWYFRSEISKIVYQIHYEKNLKYNNVSCVYRSLLRISVYNSREMMYVHMVVKTPDLGATFVLTRYRLLCNICT